MIAQMERMVGGKAILLYGPLRNSCVMNPMRR
jgi:hypothetical protein